MQAAVGAAGVSDPEGRISSAAAYTRVGTEEFVGEGEARCRPDDRFNAKVGEGIALGRAFQDLGRRIEEKRVARSACEADVQARREGKRESDAAVQAGVDEGYLQHITEMRGRPVREVIEAMPESGTVVGILLEEELVIDYWDEYFGR
jgi:hypothetical protein